jgi:hypothetical protein
VTQGNSQISGHQHRSTLVTSASVPPTRRQDGAPRGGPRWRLTRAGVFVSSTWWLCTALYLDITPLHAAEQGPRVIMSSTIQAEPGADVTLSIDVIPLDAAPDKSYIKIRGLPSAATLNEGHVIAPGAWAIALAAVPNLRLKLPARQSGRSDLVVSLVGLNGAIVAETRASLIVAGLPDSGSLVPMALVPPVSASPLAQIPAPPVTAAPQAMTAATVIASAPPIAALVPPPAQIVPAPVPVSRPPVTPEPLVAPSVGKAVMTPEELARAQRYVQRGQQELADGNVAAARLLFRRAADVAHAPGVLALAATYDPVELARLGAFTIQGDLTEARRWYEKALALGIEEAELRLRRLGNR